MNERTLIRLVNKVVEYSEENSSGMILGKYGIEQVIKFLNFKDEISILDVDIKISEYESSTGYLVKASDFLSLMGFNTKK